jgi:hypothetical protein
LVVDHTGDDKVTIRNPLVKPLIVGVAQIIPSPPLVEDGEGIRVVEPRKEPGLITHLLIIRVGGEGLPIRARTLLLREAGSNRFIDAERSANGVIAPPDALYLQRSRQEEMWASIADIPE